MPQPSKGEREQIALRVPVDLLAAATQAAEKEGTPRSEWIVEAIRLRLEGPKPTVLQLPARTPTPPLPKAARYTEPLQGRVQRPSLVVADQEKVKAAQDRMRRG